MGVLYKSKRVGRDGRVFELYKFRTLIEGTDSTNSFAKVEHYTRFGRFMRKTKIDELPQLINVLKGDITIFGYRPEEERNWNVLPIEIRKILERKKPGIIDLASLHFYNEEEILQLPNSHQTYWEKIRPMKLTLQMFFIENKCLPLKVAILWIYMKKAISSVLKK